MINDEGIGCIYDFERDLTDNVIPFINIVKENRKEIVEKCRKFIQLEYNLDNCMIDIEDSYLKVLE